MPGSRLGARETEPGRSHVDWTSARFFIFCTLYWLASLPLIAIYGDFDYEELAVFPNEAFRAYDHSGAIFSLSLHSLLFPLLR